MIDFILIIILVAIIGGALYYIISKKKKGVKCIGCPAQCGCSNTCHDTDKKKK